MDALLIEGKVNSPDVNFNNISGILKLIGRSIPENPVKFYQPLENWMAFFLATNPNKVELYIYLDYLNTHSTECVLILIKKLEGYYKDSNADVKVVWNFEVDDEDMQMLGTDLSTFVNLPFEIVEVKED